MKHVHDVRADDVAEEQTAEHARRVEDLRVEQREEGLAEALVRQPQRHLERAPPLDQHVRLREELRVEIARRLNLASNQPVKRDRDEHRRAERGPDAQQ